MRICQPHCDHHTCKTRNLLNNRCGDKTPICKIISLFLILDLTKLFARYQSDLAMDINAIYSLCSTYREREMSKQNNNIITSCDKTKFASQITIIETSKNINRLFGKQNNSH